MSLLRRFLSTSLGWLIAGLLLLCRALLIAWATLAIYYSNLPWTPLRQGLAAPYPLVVGTRQLAKEDLCQRAPSSGREDRGEGYE